MSKAGNILIFIWVILALVSFVSAFWAPLFYKIIGIAFGSLNIITIMTWVISYAVLKRRQDAVEEIAEQLNKEE
jgi:pilus assembly protein TadC